MSKELTCNSTIAAVKSVEVCRVKVKVEVVPHVIFSPVFESRDGDSRLR